MTVTPQTDELAALRARLTAIEARTARPRRRVPQRLRALAGAGLLTALLPLGIMAANPTFSDLGSAAPDHRGNIQAIADAGITMGFADPNNPNARVFYPKDTVSREEMATFLSRLGGLNGNTPIAHAATAQTVVDGGVTATSISPAGSTNGQVLTSTGNGVSWQNATGGGAPGPQGPAGPQGPIGPAGPPGPGGTGLGVNQIGAAPAGGPNSMAVPILVINTENPYGNALTINAPSAGYVYVTGKLAVQLPLALVGVQTRLRHTYNATDTFSTGQTNTYSLSILAPQTITESYVFPVQAGVNTFSIMAQSNLLGTVVVQADTSAIFVAGEVTP